MSTPSQRVPPPPDLEVPDLEVPLPQPPPERPPTQRRASGARAVQQPEAGGTANLGAEIDLGQAKSLSLELDTQTPGSASQNLATDDYFGSSLGAGDASSGFDLDDPPTALEPVAVVDNAPWPRGRHEGPVEVVQSDVEAHAAYGSSDVPFYMAPAYSFRVLKRQRVLKEELLLQESELMDREAERDQLLVDLVASLRPVIEKGSGRLREMLAGLDVTERELRLQQGQMAKVNQSLSAELERADREIAELEAARKQRQAGANAIDDKRESLHVEFTRRDAKLKRLQIEARNVTAKARELLGPEGGTLPKQFADQLEALERQRQAVVPGVTQAKQALQTAEAELAKAQQDIGELSRQVDAVRSKRRAAIRKYQQSLDSGSQSLQAAEDQQLEAAKQIAHAVLDLRGQVPVAPETLALIRAADDRVGQAALETERGRRALGAYDRDAFLLGFKVAAAPLVFLLGLLLLRAIL